MTNEEYNSQFSREELENEIWRDIPGWEGYYQASNLGRIRSLSIKVNNCFNSTRGRKGRILKVTFDKVDRHYVTLSKEGKVKKHRVSTLILLAFKGNRPEGMECCHRPDSNPCNNRENNLHWGTHSSNLKDKIENGTYQFGSNNSMCKLTEKEVLEIRTLCKDKKMSQELIARKYNVSRRNISHINNRTTWSWLK